VPLALKDSVLGVPDSILILADPLNATPLMVRAVAKTVADPAFPVQVAAVVAFCTVVAPIAPTISAAVAVDIALVPLPLRMPVIVLTPMPPFETVTGVASEN
jgi:hypothetical protein